MKRLDLTWADVDSRAIRVVMNLLQLIPKRLGTGPYRLFGIPNGGIHAAQAMLGANPEEAPPMVLSKIQSTQMSSLTI